jgi:hypothetical protein
MNSFDKWVYGLLGRLFTKNNNKHGFLFLFLFLLSVTVGLLFYYSTSKNTTIDPFVKCIKGYYQSGNTCKKQKPDGAKDSDPSHCQSSKQVNGKCCRQDGSQPNTLADSYCCSGKYDASKKVCVSASSTTTPAIATAATAATAGTASAVAAAAAACTKDGSKPSNGSSSGCCTQKLKNDGNCGCEADYTTLSGSGQCCNGSTTFTSGGSTICGKCILDGSTSTDAKFCCSGKMDSTGKCYTCSPDYNTPPANDSTKCCSGNSYQSKGITYCGTGLSDGTTTTDAKMCISGNTFQSGGVTYCGTAVADGNTATDAKFCISGKSFQSGGVTYCGSLLEDGKPTTDAKLCLSGKSFKSGDKTYCGAACVNSGSNAYHNDPDTCCSRSKLPHGECTDWKEITHSCAAGKLCNTIGKDIRWDRARHKPSTYQSLPSSGCSGYSNGMKKDIDCQCAGDWSHFWVQSINSDGTPNMSGGARCYH